MSGMLESRRWYVYETEKHGRLALRRRRVLAQDALIHEVFGVGSVLEGILQVVSLHVALKLDLVGLEGGGGVGVGENVA